MENLIESSGFVAFKLNLSLVFGSEFSCLLISMTFDELVA